MYHLVYFIFISCHRIVYTDRIPAIGIHKLHAWHIRVAVTDVDHVLKRYPYVLRCEIIIHCRIIYIKHTLGYSEKVLRLVGIIHHLRRPLHHSVLIKIEAAGIYALERSLLGNLRALYHLLKS